MEKTSDLLNENVARLRGALVRGAGGGEYTPDKVANGLGTVIGFSRPEGGEFEKQLLRVGGYPPEQYGGTGQLHQAALELARQLQDDLSPQDWQGYFGRQTERILGSERQ